MKCSVSPIRKSAWILEPVSIRKHSPVQYLGDFGSAIPSTQDSVGLEEEMPVTANSSRVLMLRDYQVRQGASRNY